MLVKDVMSHEVVQVGPDTPLKEVAALLVERAITGVPVVDEGRLVGILTESDVIARTAYGEEGQGEVSALAALLSGAPPRLRRPAGLTAGDLMTRHVETTRADESVAAAARRMLERGVKRLPVVEDGAVIGILSRRDVLQLFGQSDHALEVAVRDLLRRALYVPPEHLIDVNVVEGVVELRGRVYLRRDRRVIEAIVGAYPGVIDVDDELTFEHEDTPGALD